jgi:hypothetical protein
MADERDRIVSNDDEVEAHARAGQSENTNEDLADDTRERLSANENEELSEDD